MKEPSFFIVYKDYLVESTNFLVYTTWIFLSFKGVLLGDIISCLKLFDLVIVSCVHLVGVVFSFFIFIVGGSGGAAGMTVTFSSLMAFLCLFSANLFEHLLPFESVIEVRNHQPISVWGIHWWSCGGGFLLLTRILTWPTWFRALYRAPDKNRYIGYFILSILNELGDLIFFRK